MKALISGNKVIDVVETEFEVHPSLTWMDCPDECRAYSWTLVDGVLTAPAEPPAMTYDMARNSEYPTIADQLDDIYHNGIDAWKATIKVTKDKYPKE